MSKRQARSSRRSLFGRGGFTPIGVDLGARSAKAIQLEGRPGDWRIRAATVLENPSGKRSVEPEVIARLCDVLDRQGFAGREVVLAAPPAALEADVLELPPRSAGVPVEQIARSELARTARLEPNEFEMACWDLPTAARASNSTNVMAVAIRNADADPLLDAFEAQGMHVRALDIQAWALARVAALSAQANPAVTAVLDLGWAGGLLVLLSQGLVIYQRKLADAGLDTLRRALIAQLGSSEALVDHLLTAHTTAASAGSSQQRSINSPGEDAEITSALRSLIGQFVEGMVGDLQASFAYAAHRYSSPVTDLLLVGGGAEVTGVARHLERRLDLKVKVPTPIDLAECPAPLIGKCRSAAMSPALGLALYGCRGMGVAA